MSQWSFLSWAFMTIPALFPMYMWITLGLLWLFAQAVIALLEKVTSGRKR